MNICILICLEASTVVRAPFGYACVFGVCLCTGVFGKLPYGLQNVLADLRMCKAASCVIKKDRWRSKGKNEVTVGSNIFVFEK